MISNCPHCRVTLKFSDSQLARLKQALKNLQPGTQLTIKCPQCGQPFKLQADGSIKAPATGPNVTPPAPPDLEWLKTGRFKEEEKVEDVPMALVLHPNQEAREQVKKAMESVGYRVLLADTVEQAIDQMRFINFACIAYHEKFEPGGLDKSQFHDYMRRMSMERRRYVFYILFGAQFRSLYDLEALAYSANLVVAEQDQPHFDLILRKAIPAYEELFGPILEELGAYGKR